MRHCTRLDPTLISPLSGSAEAVTGSIDRERMASTSNLTEYTSFKTAQEMFEHLAVLPLAEWGHMDHSNCWVFRGHGDADWLLQPSAWRDDGQKILGPLYSVVDSGLPPGIPADHRKWMIQCGAEVEAVRQFATIADQLGFSIPYLADELSWEPVSPHASSMPIDELFALAQHHGIPTRLIDWTRRPLVAAFFAAEKAVELMAQSTKAIPDKLAVWAYDLSLHRCFVSFDIATVAFPRHQISFCTHKTLYLRGIGARTQNIFRLDNGQGLMRGSPKNGKLGILTRKTGRSHFGKCPFR